MPVKQLPIGTRSNSWVRRELTEPPTTHTPSPQIAPPIPTGMGGVRSRQPLVAPSASLLVGRAKSKEEEEDSDKDDFEEPGDRTVNLERGRGGRRPSLSNTDPAMIQLLAGMQQQMITLNQGMQQQMAALTAAIANPAAAPKKSFKTPTLKAPDPFDGTQPSKLRKFLQSVQTIFFNDQRTFETDKEKVMYTSSFLTGKAGKWIEPYLSRTFSYLPYKGEWNPICIGAVCSNAD
ncbi:hypothetical protein PPACK8108_LOCUS21157 [Phakopsora pachyrhizi]|uniref:DUF4939 domain-containing protein n=1 Tax=Phakopsora pachyrhizi TaxID=170000 RepID=A0AAV0BJ80_PHAPC|nr:hypothetical protein PPACK8108_LOCUS21157 [Phakopsora pachyrhizi]